MLERSSENDTSTIEAEQSEALTIFDLPIEIWLEISVHLTPQALFNWALINRKAYSNILIDEIWRSKFFKYFNYRSRVNNNVLAQFKRVYIASNANCPSDSARRLFDFVKENDLKSIIDNKFTLEDVDSNYRMLNWANVHRHQSILDYFYSLAVAHFTDNVSTKHSKLNPLRRNKTGCSIFEFAVACNQSLEVLNFLLEQGALINGEEIEHSNVDILTPLIIAVLVQNKGIVNFLLDKGALIDKRSLENGLTSLMCAVLVGDLPIIENLISRGANAALRVRKYNSLDLAESGDTPLIFAIRLVKKNPALYKNIIKALMVSPAAFGKSWASPYYSPLAIASADQDVALILLKQWSRFQLNPPRLWFQIGDVYISSYVKLLCDIKTLSETQDAWKELQENLPSFNDILMKAVKYDNQSIVEFLLQANICDINYSDEFQKTFLMRAKSTYVARLLLNAGADVTLEDESGHTALFYVIKRKNSALVSLLLENPSTRNALEKVYPEYDNEYGRQHLVKKGETLLHVATREGDPHVIEALTQANFSLAVRNAEGELPVDVLTTNLFQADEAKLKNYISIIRPSEKPFRYAFKIAGHTFLATPITFFGHTCNLSQDAKLAAARDLYAVVFEEKAIDLSRHRACYFNGRLGRIYKELENKGLISRYQLSPMELEQSTLDYELPELG